MMYRLILFFATLASFLFASLYTPYSGQVVIILNQSKVTMDLWFSLVMLVLLNLILIWILRKLYAFLSLKSIWLKWRHESRGERYQRRFEQAVMLSLSEQYDAAVAKLKHLNVTETADRILYISWLNQTDYREKMEQLFSDLGQVKHISPSWMIWFRAYLYHQQGCHSMAVQVLVEALDKGLYSAQMIRSMVAYANDAAHYKILLSYEREIRKVFRSDAVDVLVNCYICHLDQLIQHQDNVSFIKQVEHVSKDVMRHPKMLFYQLRGLALTSQEDALIRLLLRSDITVDRRIMPLIIDATCSIEQKLEIVKQGLVHQPNHSDLLYVLSYLLAQQGEENDAIALIGKAIESSLGTRHEQPSVQG